MYVHHQTRLIAKVAITVYRRQGNVYRRQGNVYRRKDTVYLICRLAGSNTVRTC